MSATEVHNASRDAAVGKADMKLEVQIIPVSDVDRSKQFYQRLGWRLDDDVAPLDGLRIVQFTPPGSGASVTFGTGLTTAAPGSAEGGLIVSDIEAAHDELTGRGIDASEFWHGPPFPPEARHPAPTPSAPATGRSSPSPIPTAIPGSSRRSPRGSPAGSTPLRRHSHPQRT
jgi:catechol 2,3-dioxygenase-like lactoylglutathione lyase family enzyme